MCSKAREFQQEGKLIEAVDNYELCLQELRGVAGRKKIQETIGELRTEITNATVSDIRSLVSKVAAEPLTLRLPSASMLPYASSAVGVYKSFG